MTFQGYHRMRRMGLALESLRRGENPLVVGLEYGYESSSGFRDAFERTFGATPGRCDHVVRIVTTQVETPAGKMVAGATDEGVCLLEFADRRAFPKQVALLRRRMMPHGSGNHEKCAVSIVPGTNRHLELLSRQLAEYFHASRTVFTVPLVTPGSLFQRRVWDALQTIPYGQTTSYEELARRINRPGAQRAVGRANGENRVAILIPCHRVVRSDGTLCGYGGGVWRKQYLLDLEAAAARLRKAQ